LLGVAAKAFKVETDERLEQIIEYLPGANCGGCGYAGCGAMAEGLLAGKAELASCAAVKAEQAEKIADLLGTKSVPKEAIVAKVLCKGTCDVTGKKYEYSGVRDCVAAQRYGGGEKACLYGCIGFGSCVQVCKFDAISIENGVAQIAEEKCVACGACANICPRKLIELVPVSQKALVTCLSKDRGVFMKQVCTKGCIGCGICVKNCEAGAIKVQENVAVIDRTLCTGCGTCAEKCPKKIIDFHL